MQILQASPGCCSYSRGLGSHDVSYSSDFFCYSLPPSSPSPSPSSHHSRLPPPPPSPPSRARVKLRWEVLDLGRCCNPMLLALAWIASSGLGSNSVRGGKGASRVGQHVARGSNPLSLNVLAGRENKDLWRLCWLKDWEAALPWGMYK